MAQAALHGGPLGDAVAAHVAQAGGLVTAADLAAVRPIDRAPVRGDYRGYAVYGPPPPSSGGAHIAQMLNILEGYDVAGLGFGSIDGIHLLAEAMKIAFADRAAVTADPAFVNIPLDRLVAKDYAAERRAADRDGAGRKPGERGRRTGRIGQHHPCHGGRFPGQRGGDHPDHQWACSAPSSASPAPGWSPITTC